MIGIFLNNESLAKEAETILNNISNVWYRSVRDPKVILTASLDIKKSKVESDLIYAGIYADIKCLFISDFIYYSTTLKGSKFLGRYH